MMWHVGSLRHLLDTLLSRNEQRVDAFAKIL
jgi:hypothetical protein